ncbi:MAG: flagellin FliC, partial [Proteobacteria bacterium]|nr:flagellin FliC [Pseudomonadota bacterium]
LDVNVDKLGLEELTVNTKFDAQRSLASIDSAVEKVSSVRGQLGAIENRLESTIKNTAISIENLSAARSRIKDVDIAEETSEMAKQNILMQAGTAMLAQANSVPKMALSLLQNG